MTFMHLIRFKHHSGYDNFYLRILFVV